MGFSQWLPLLGICLLGAMSPGPSLAVILRCTMSGGRSAGLSAAFAHGAGVGLYGLLTVTGLAMLITRVPLVFLTLQLGGALYLVYLGLGALRGDAPANLAAAPGTHSRRAAREGFLVACLNPKLAVFMLALFSQFLQPGCGLGDKVLMAVTVALTDACWYALVVLLLARPGFLERLGRRGPLIERAFGAILIALALTVLGRALSV